MLMSTTMDLSPTAARRRPCLPMSALQPTIHGIHTTWALCRRVSACRELIPAPTNGYSALPGTIQGGDVPQKCPHGVARHAFPATNPPSRLGLAIIKPRRNDSSRNDTGPAACICGTDRENGVPLSTHVPPPPETAAWTPLCPVPHAEVVLSVSCPRAQAFPHGLHLSVALPIASPQM
ncbi:hypothetical protein HBH56_151840 [Parastagonospora nodorum]|uniref:Uncharacterized protein n=2 Tax=Phaeosphaeria nodorum (strain SN15 / ATCC MYA-4574 / FGSC 10173) TaxID=321614 RepID=A0A7U2F402_PHANO|nr:hypothetical protein HBH56_151840 [Parastagonospora nodorum]QRC96139.1 hypothetical protein JI435_057750 [Parastagonospora nodorum SN15]KAH3926819.1 hypothetical protein HBH54_165860 [Parastagonospora nodorum]KAH3971871.1 hypothetical protein HBH51_108170 [Parastagonospora nodorum]KAH4029625.1 hypothetical protein HBI09_135720 [Parastagonospora nodorum]